jgi:NTE family protein
MRVGLVLGAGGMVGQAYHAGVLAALEEELGWDARTADLIVGTSAGSVAGSALRLGVEPRDLAAWAGDEPLSPTGAAFFDALGGAAEDLPAPHLRDALHGWHLPSRKLLTRAVTRPWRLRLTSTAGALLPDGRYDLQQRTRVLDQLGIDWPEGLWICACRRDDGRRVVFGRGAATPARLSQAVAASCAIPAYFSPVRIGGHDHVDGGMHSPTNADVLAHSGLDLVIVVSPMSAAHGSSRAPDAAMRWAMHRRLESEARRLRREGAEVVRFEPNPRTLSVMGVNAMAEDRAAAVVAAAREDTAAHLRSGRTAQRLTGLPRRLRSVA